MIHTFAVSAGVIPTKTHLATNDTLRHGATIGLGETLCKRQVEDYAVYPLLPLCKQCEKAVSNATNN